MKELLVIKVQSFSDIVTNSSSELFVIKNQDGKFKDSAIEAILKDLVEVYKNASEYSGETYLLSPNESLSNMLHVYEASAGPRPYLRESYNVEYSPGDIIIESDTENSIPYSIVEFIQDWFGSACERYHLG